MCDETCLWSIIDSEESASALLPPKLWLDELLTSLAPVTHPLTSNAAIITTCSEACLNATAQQASRIEAAPYISMCMPILPIMSASAAALTQDPNNNCASVPHCKHVQAAGYTS